MKRLEVGDRFRLHPDCLKTDEQPGPIYEVIRVNVGSATVRSLAASHTTITKADGTVVADFWKSGRPFHISAHSSVILV